MLTDRRTSAVALFLLLAALFAGCGDGVATIEDPDETGPTGESSDVKIGYLMAPDENGDPAEPIRRVHYRKIDGNLIAGGDILLNPRLVVPLQEAADRGISQTSGGLAATDRSGALWPDGRIPYTVDENLPQKQKVQAAIDHWEQKTVIDFVRRSGERSYIEFTTEPQPRLCFSAVGRQVGRQEIRLGSACDRSSIIHEIGHAVGLFHEHQRTDRDQYVDILWENITDKYKYAFKTYAQRGLAGQDIGPYDYRSIMHYNSNYFTKNGQPTIIKKRTGQRIRSADSLTDDDIRGIEQLYGADDGGGGTNGGGTSSGGTSGGTDDAPGNCEEILSCRSDCSSDQCELDCFYEAPRSAQQDYNAYARCYRDQCLSANDTADCLAASCREETATCRPDLLDGTGGTSSGSGSGSTDGSSTTSGSGGTSSGSGGTTSGSSGGTTSGGTTSGGTTSGGSGGTTSTSSSTCPDILACMDGCSSQSCKNDCFYDATQPARTDYNAYATCYQNNCVSAADTVQCLNDRCRSETQVCAPHLISGSSSGSTSGGSTGGSQTNAPTGLSPSGGATLSGDRIDLTCSSVSGATTYEFEIQYYDGSNWQGYYTYHPSRASKTFYPQVNDIQYRWRARARTASGWTATSSWARFRYR